LEIGGRSGSGGEGEGEYDEGLHGSSFLIG
jgi:hypothetical protein